MKKISDFKSKGYSSNTPEIREIDYYGCDVLPVQELEKLKYSKE